MNEMLHFQQLFFLVLTISWKRAPLEVKGTLLVIRIVMLGMGETVSRTERTWWLTGSGGGLGEKEKEPVSSKVWEPEQEKAASWTATKWVWYHKSLRVQREVTEVPGTHRYKPNLSH